MVPALLTGAHFGWQVSPAGPSMCMMVRPRTNQTTSPASPLLLRGGAAAQQQQQLPMGWQQHRL